MASGDVLIPWTAAHAVAYVGQTTSSYWARNGYADVRIGGSTPAERIRGISNDTTGAPHYFDFMGIMPAHYAGTTGVTVKISFVNYHGADAGNFTLEAAFRRFADDAEDLDSAHAYDYNEHASTTGLPGATSGGQIVTEDIHFTDGADMDSVAVGEFFILRFESTNNGVGLQQIVAVTLTET